MSALSSLMQDDYRLTVDHIRKHLATNSGQVVSLEHLDESGLPMRFGYREVDRRLHRLAHGLRSLGIVEGERVGTFTWNTLEHLELFVGVPAYGAVLHTVNVRLFAEQLVYVINHAQDRAIFIAPDLVPALVSIADQLTHLRHVVVCGDLDGLDTGDLPGVTTYAALLAAASEEDFDFPELAETQAAALCYTSGTTGNPKGVLYSHRSIALHASSLLGVDSFALRRGDRVLAVVPMFHVNAWGLPYASVLIDADIVLPGRDLRPPAIAGIIERYRATVMGGVPTVYSDLLAYVDANGTDLSSLRECFCGGSAVSETLMRAYEDRHGVSVIQAWGMTETSPVCTVSRAPAGVTGEDVWRYRTTQGRAVPWVDLRLVDEFDQLVPHDGSSSGELEVRGPWIAAAYYDDDSGEVRFHDGWLRTGDVATLTPDGFLQIVDRAKDVIKSGGEWISSVELENQLSAHPAVAAVAVISVPDPKWEERPLACVVVRDGETVTPEELREHLLARVARWWVPERFVFVSDIPRTGVGKFNKRALRASVATGELAEPAVAELVRSPSPG
ncbi:long-chain fatty acid--CoA ligase [Nocardioides sp.]|uniref:long-chain fatty acid--CoA ligase n=1 Tax=Nocardioides sp. TaxID=35761 RepID=UPI0039E2280B